MTKLTCRSWRLWLSVTCTTIALLALPSTSSAAVGIAPTASQDIIYEPVACNRMAGTVCTPRMFAGPRYIGWVRLDVNYCPPGFACTKEYRTSMPAWSWNGSAWTRASINGGWVYVYPYSGQWRWAWTQQSGWVAVDRGRFEIFAS